MFLTFLPPILNGDTQQQYATEGLTATIAISPQYLVEAWAVAKQPTVKVEKGWGSGVFQDLYPHTDGRLYTAINGGGLEASVFADGSKLFVETPYNQCLANAVADGHPTAITDSSRRVLLDASIPNAPRFAGIQQGTQDASQHATERGYDTNISVATNGGVTFLSLDQLPSSLTTDYVAYRNNGGATLDLLVNPANNRWYPNEVVVAGLNPLRMPALKCHFADSPGTLASNDAIHSIAGGVSHGNSVGGRTTSATSTPIRIWGAANPLTGACYAFVCLSGAYVDWANVRENALLTKALHKTCCNVYGANELTLYAPVQWQTYRLTSWSPAKGDIRIVCASAPNRVIEARFNSGDWATIGTTDASGYLVGTLSDQSAATGTLDVRVAGQATVAASRTNVRIGAMVTRGGQSNADGRGDDITLTANRSIASNTWANSTATQKSWIWVFLQTLASTYSVPVAMGGRSAGATYLYFNSGGSTDGRHGHWNANNPGTVTVHNFSEWVHYGRTQQTEPNFYIWHQGEEDANGGTSKANYKQALIDMWIAYKAKTGAIGKLWIMVLGRVGTVTAANVNAIRYATIESVNENPTLFEMGGSLAHLQVGDGGSDTTHFWTQSQKEAVAAVFIRHAFGSGRAHRYSSGSKSTNTATLNFIGGSGDLVVGASPTLGWTCTDNSGSITVSNCSASGNTLTLSFDRSIVGSLTVQWCSHFSGIGATISDSDSTTPLPPEPFEAVL